MSVNISGEFRGEAEDSAPGEYFLAGTMRVSGGSSYTFDPQPNGQGAVVVVGLLEEEGVTNDVGEIIVTGIYSTVTVQGSDLNRAAQGSRSVQALSPIAAEPAPWIFSQVASFRSSTPSLQVPARM